MGKKTDQAVDEKASAPRGASASPLAFAKDFPDDPELQALLGAFEAGHYDQVRKLAPQLASKTTDERVAAAARELRARLDPDPLARNLLLAAIGLLVILAAWSFTNHHH